MSQAPPEHVRAELERLLEVDQTRLGQVFRLSKRGLDAAAIAQELGVSTSNFVVNQRTITRALLEGVLPSGPVIQNAVAGAIRQRSKSPELSAEAKDYLSGLIERLQPASLDTEAPDTLPTMEAARPSLRDQVHIELVERATALVQAIREEASIDADDYQRVASADLALDALTRLIQVQTTSRTTMALHKAGRLDLSLEAAILMWAGVLPLSLDLVESARGRLDYWRNT